MINLRITQSKREVVQLVTPLQSNGYMLFQVPFMDFMLTFFLSLYEPVLLLSLPPYV